MPLFQLSSTLVALAAAFGVLNHFFLRLPSTIGLLLIALAVSLAAMGLDALAPELGVADAARGLVGNIDFSEALLNGMLGFLLFAGALHTDFRRLREQRWSIAMAASVGVVISAGVVGLGYSWLSSIPFLGALAFGALISPTDPVAVLGLLRQAKVPEVLETRIAGESLFNDGSGYVLFLAIVSSAFPGSHSEGGLAIAGLFLQEAGGGAALGMATGWLVFHLLKRMDSYALEVLLTLALAMGTYALCDHLHLSGPIAVVVAGLIIGNHGVEFGMSETTRKYVLGFWQLVDEILNAVLFIIVGIEILNIPFTGSELQVGLITIPIVILGRALGVGIGMIVYRRWREGIRGAFPIAVWGGLRGGISIALAMSLPESEWKPLVLTSTYIVVIFSMLVQGLTFAKLIRLLRPE